MLYQTTLDNKNAYTAYRAMCAQTAPDAGAFVPFRLERFDAQRLARLQAMRFSDCVAQIINLFFSSRLNGTDVEFAVGRSPVRVTLMSYRVLIAQLWHNPSWRFAGMVDALASSACMGAVKPDQWGDFVQIAVRTAALFGLSTEPVWRSTVEEAQALDIAVRCGDFSSVMSAWYARKMGLPIRKILVACDAGSALWELLRNGKVRIAPTGASSDAQTLPAGMERLIFDVFGVDAARQFYAVRRRGGVYSLPDTPEAEALKDVVFACVVGSDRAEAILRTSGQTEADLLDRSAAFALGALQDYRASGGESYPALLLSERADRD